jgi:glycosyltransferase involved in cell wall biosynthesis
MLSVSIIISCYNQNKSVSKIIDLLEAGSHSIQEVIIADDGSNPTFEETPANLLSRCIQKFIFLTHEDKGFRKCKILNEAIRRSSSEYILFLDGDCLPHRHFVKDHIAIAERGYFVQGRRCFIDEKSVAPLLDSKTSLSKLIFSGKVSGLLKSSRFPLPIIKRNTSMYGILGCNVGIWRDDLITVNGFDEDFEGWGREDSDLGARLYNLGLQRKMVYGRAVVYHLNHPKNSRESLNRNDEKLSETIKSKKIRCRNGIIKE